VDEKYYLSEKAIQGILNHKEREKEKGHGFGVKFHEQFEKMSALKVGGKGVDDIVKIDKKGKIKDNQSKASCFTAGGNSGGNHSDMDLIYVSSRGRGEGWKQELEPRFDGKTNCLSSVQKDNLVMQLNPSTESGGKQPYQQNRVYDSNGISPALCANKADLIIKENTLIDFSHQNEGLRYYEDKSPTLNQRDYKEPRCIYKNSRIRRLTPTECARLQTIPTWYKWECSDTQQYRMLGNGWTVDVIKHILSYL
jgi:DNA (cytosine-5)-methyltransferase 3A